MKTSVHSLPGYSGILEIHLVQLILSMDNDEKVQLRRGSKFRVSIERMALISSYSKDNCFRLASQTMTTLCNLQRFIQIFCYRSW